MLTQVDDLFEKRRAKLGVIREYPLFYNKQAYRTFWWERRLQEEWSPSFSKQWCYHYNTYNFVKQDWSLHRIDNIYRRLLGHLTVGLNLFFPTPAHYILKWITKTSLFESLVWLTARVLQLIDYSTTTFKARFDSFWQYPSDSSTPKKYVRWFFGRMYRYNSVKKKTQRSLNRNTSKPSKLVKKLNQFYSK